MVSSLQMNVMPLSERAINSMSLYKSTTDRIHV